MPSDFLRNPFAFLEFDLRSLEVITLKTIIFPSRIRISGATQGKESDNDI